MSSLSSCNCYAQCVEVMYLAENDIVVGAGPLGWVINNFIAYWRVTYIIGLTVCFTRAYPNGMVENDN